MIRLLEKLRIRGGFLVMMIIVLSVISGMVHAQSSDYPDLNIKGYVKELGGFSFSNDLSTLRYDNIVHNRLESSTKLSTDFEFRADIRTRLFNGWTVENAPGYASQLSNDPGFWDMSLNLIETDHAILNTAVDRLHLSYFKDDVEIHVGRQRINWGRTMVWNPNDLFNTYAYLDFDYEERPGADAIYGRYSWSYASSIEMGFKPGRTLQETVFAILTRGSFGEYDVQGILGYYHEQLVIGGGWSGYIDLAGFKGEWSYFTPFDNDSDSGTNIVPDNGLDDDEATLSIVLGVDYMFSNSLYMNAEVLYNGGHESRISPVSALNRPPGSDNLFIAQTGYFVNSSYPFSPLTQFSFGMMGSFSKSMVIFIPQISHSLTSNTDFLVIAQILEGEYLKDLTPVSNALYVRLKWSF
jgi:hypothetical protein